jgi:hypothetical protein
MPTGGQYDGEHDPSLRLRHVGRALMLDDRRASRLPVSIAAM